MPVSGNFDSLARPYQNARKGFGREVFEYIARKIGDLKNKKVLDVGCGTGISTRQLAEYGPDVVGSDVAMGMIEEAKKAGGPIKYFVAPADRLPFDDGSFDLVTAFSAFHWFATAESIGEIKRVLNRRGVFAVVNKHDISGIRKDVVPLFKKYVQHPVGKDDYRPEDILRQYDFEKVYSKTFQGTETFSLAEAVEYLQSIALWNAVSPDDRELLRTEVKTFCSEVLEEQNVLKRVLETTVVLGWLK